MNFAAPWAFLFLLPLAVVVWRVFRRGRKSGILFAPMRYLPVKTAGWRVWAMRVLPLFFLVGLFLLIVAAARPRTTLSHERKSVNAIAIGMVVDVSGSMEGLDLTPKGSDYQTRLEVVKDLFADFVKKRPDDLIGLVTFGGYASTRSPLTADHAALIHVLRGVEIPRGSLDAQGRPVDQEETLTAIGDGLATGLARLQDAEPKTRIIVLLSDGESNTGVITPEQAAEMAEKLNIRVYAIGVGSNGSMPVRVRNLFGQETIAYAEVTFNEAQLKEIAQKSGGRYFGVRDHDGLAAALEEINTLETTKIARDVYDRYNEHFVWFLLWGAVFVLLSVSLQMQLLRRMV